MGRGIGCEAQRKNLLFRGEPTWYLTINEDQTLSTDARLYNCYLSRTVALAAT